MNARLPQLLNVRGIMDETGLKRAGAEALMRRLPKVRIEGHKAVYVKRADVLAYLDENTEHVVCAKPLRSVA